MENGNGEPEPEKDHTASLGQPQPNRELTVAQAARELEVTVQTIRAWTGSGKLPSIRSSNGWRLILASDIDKLREERVAERGAFLQARTQGIEFMFARRREREAAARAREKLDARVTLPMSTTMADRLEALSVKLGIPRARLGRQMLEESIIAYEEPTPAEKAMRRGRERLKIPVDFKMTERMTAIRNKWRCDDTEAWIIDHLEAGASKQERDLLDKTLRLDMVPQRILWARRRVKTLKEAIDRIEEIGWERLESEDPESFRAPAASRAAAVPAAIMPMAEASIESAPAASSNIDSTDIHGRDDDYDLLDIG
jgi:excisionase family DNA binding protein